MAFHGVKNRVRRIPEVGRRYRPEAVYIGDGNLLVGTRWGTRMIVPSTDLSLTPALALKGEYDPWLAAFMRRHLRSGGCFVDVGAHFGTFTLLAAALVGNSGTVVAYEATPTTLAVLKRNIAMNYRDYVSVVEVAVWDEEGYVELTTPGLFSGSTHVASLRSQDASGLLKVGAEPLDNRCADLRVDILKVDVEGSESRVLRGARRLLDSRGVRYLVFEAIPGHAGAEWPRLLRELERHIGSGAKLRAPRGTRGLTRPIEVHELTRDKAWSQLVLEFGRSTSDSPGNAR